MEIKQGSIMGKSKYKNDKNSYNWEKWVYNIVNQLWKRIKTTSEYKGNIECTSESSS